MTILHTGSHPNGRITGNRNSLVEGDSYKIAVGGSIPPGSIDSVGGHGDPQATPLATRGVGSHRCE